MQEEAQHRGKVAIGSRTDSRGKMSIGSRTDQRGKVAIGSRTALCEQELIVEHQTCGMGTTFVSPCLHSGAGPLSKRQKQRRRQKLKKRSSAVSARTMAETPVNLGTSLVTENGAMSGCQNGTRPKIQGWFDYVALDADIERARGNFAKFKQERISECSEERVARSSPGLRGWADARI